MNMATDPELPVHVKFVKLMPTTFELVFGAIFYGFLLVAVSAGVYSAIALHYSNEHIENLEVKTNDISYTTNVNFRARIQELEATTRKLESERYVIEVQGVEDWSEEVIKELGERLQAQQQPNVFEELPTPEPEKET